MQDAVFKPICKIHFVKSPEAANEKKISISNAQRAHI